MFIEIQPYENETLSVRFKAGREDFSKILQAIKKVPNRAWIPAQCFWTIPADRNSCDLLLNNIYSEGFCRVDSDFIGANCESADSYPHNAIVLNTAMVEESNTPTAPDIQDILRKLDAVITAKHYSKRTREAYSYWISRFIREHKDKNLITFSDVEINSFVSRLATKEKVAASSQNQALSALLFLYKKKLGTLFAIIISVSFAYRNEKL